ncbi:unnamed protein product [Blepharisma stoltei]|uniref:Uncharacterized protein n=1 Tax=Blepharisma stoltei TaxID=1481888 RepID=A0AAU9JDA4_9CILI|nr:unnamed protein product [Blepharisma stoltei]
MREKLKSLENNGIFYGLLNKSIRVQDGETVLGKQAYRYVLQLGWYHKPSWLIIKLPMSWYFFTDRIEFKIKCKVIFAIISNPTISKRCCLQAIRSLFFPSLKMPHIEKMYLMTIRFLLINF